MNDEELVRQIQSGKTELFEIFVKRYTGVLVNLFNKRGHRDEIDDLVQNVWLKTFENIGGFRENSKFFTWFYSIAINESRNYFTARTRLKRDFRVEQSLNLDEKNEDEIPELATDTLDPMLEIMTKQIEENIFKKLSEIKLGARTVFGLKEMSRLNLDYKGVAEVSEYKIGGTKVTNHMVKKKLMECLD